MPAVDALAAGAADAGLNAFIKLPPDIPPKPPVTAPINGSSPFKAAMPPPVAAPASAAVPILPFANAAPPGPKKAPAAIGNKTSGLKISLNQPIIKPVNLC